MYINVNIYIYIIISFIQTADVISIAPKPPAKCFCHLRLVQARATSASFFVNKTDGLEERVEKVNETHGGGFKARIMQVITGHVLHSHWTSLDQLFLEHGIGVDVF